MSKEELKPIDVSKYTITENGNVIKEELEKENAELKTKVTALENANRAMVKELDDTTSGGLSVLENVVRSKEQLTKAKEIIKSLLDCLRQDTNDPQTDYYVCRYMDKAEQFLKEE